jgi:four helix bundle protein
LENIVGGWQQQLAVFMDGHKSLRVFQLAYELAMEIFEMSKVFPKDERYSLTDQIRRSSRSVPANIAEGYRKRQYPNAFANKMSDADGEATETQVWLDVSMDCGYISKETHDRMIGRMIQNPGKYKPRPPTPPTAAADRRLIND